MHFKMNRHTLEILGRNYGGSVWRSGWQYSEQVIVMQDILKLPMKWVRKGERPADDKYLSLSELIIRQSSK